MFFLKMIELGAVTDVDLIEIAKNSSRDINERALSLSLLGQRKARAALPFLLDVADREEDPLLVWEALSAVGLLRSRQATRPLIKLIRNCRESIKRRAAVFALGQLNDERARPVLVSILSSQEEEPAIKSFASEALGLLQLKRGTIRLLIKSLTDPSTEVRYSSICALGALRSKEALSTLNVLVNDKSVVSGEESIADRVSLVISQIERTG